MESRVVNGRYQIDEVLGRGGMATVYRAHDLKLGRSVAIKVLHDHYASDPQFLRRFEHEAQAAANLSAHPNVIDVYDVGQEDALHYIVMEYVEGQTLKDLIEREAPLPAEQAVRIAEQVGEALAAAHRLGLVHRDIKPQNVMVSPDGRVRVADFGIAKGTRTPGLTDPGMTFGTAEYISPEQVQGSPATPQSDIYSLGVVLYEMLTGHLPFSGDTPIAVAMQHVQTEATPPRRLNPAIPPQLESLLLQAMAKDPSARPASARAFAQDLRSYQERGAQQTIVGTAVAPAPRPAAPQDRSQRYAPSGAEAAPRRPAPLPLRPAVAARPRSGSSCAVFVLGMALLAGVIGLAYIVLATDFLDRVAGFFPSPSVPTAPAGVIEPTLQPTPTGEQEEATPTATTVAMVPVPDVVGQSDADARRIIKEAGLSFDTNPPVNDATVPQGFVVSQNPPAGSEVPAGELVTYTVSLGPKIVEVPDVKRQPFEVARSTLQNLGFQVSYREQPSATVQKGFVIAQNPEAGMRIPAGGAVVVTVSLGDVIAFPDIIGLQRDQAEQILARVEGVRLEYVDEQGADRLGSEFDNYRPNEVISATANGQPIANGQYIPRGSSIVLGVREP